ncbi:hypothetical protein GCM10023185_01570 [Hymenobacter saemangeumensis]|uniref:GSCFA domain-containing protein n=1 Tax=Hymenobacter saemangeumensis TaxID=1084522 RepID=A0ABP8HXS3_9BACT
MFRTELTLTPASRQLSRTARVLTLGSCFADSMGARLVMNKVETLVNPFGTVFQPLALAQLLRAAAGDSVDWQQHVVEARGRWQSYDLHGTLGAASPVELLQTVQQLVQRTADFVRSADLVVLTLGTAWAYRLRETGELVSNCHKMPADLFVKELLTPDEIINALAETHAYLRRINPGIQIILTVSPVRHVKDTLQLNAVSKSVLRVACHYLSELLDGVSYFPAYELLLDDLRDYRFYASDMLHPSEVAEDYIWDKFARTYFDVDFGRFRKEWSAIRQSLGHRPLHEGAPEHRQFLENTRERLQRLVGQQVPVEAELHNLEQRIAALPLPPPPPAAPEPEDDGEERIDIGNPEDGEAAAGAEPAASPAPADSRPGRLSPEEFRRQRAERDRRGRDERRPERPSRQEAAPVPEPAEAMPAPVDEQADLDVAEEYASATEVLGLSSETAATATLDPAPAQEPGKKKKRRSRGGAKRTARKHAARLAAEAEGQATAGQELPADFTENATADTATTPALPASTPTPAAPLSEPATAGENTPAVVLPETPAVAPVEQVVEPLPEPAPALRPEERKGKKSSVITKSTPVKRGSRRAPRVVDAPPAPLPLQGQAELPELPEVVATPTAPVLPVLPQPEAAAELAASPVPSKKSRSKKSGKAAAPDQSLPLPGTDSPTTEPVTPVAEALEQPAAPAAAKGKGKGPKRKALYQEPAAEPAPAPVLPPAEAAAAEVPKPAPKRGKGKVAAPVVPPAAEAPAAPAAPVEAPAPKARRKPAKAAPAAPTEPAPAAEPAAAKPKARSRGGRGATKKE